MSQRAQLQAMGMTPLRLNPLGRQLLGETRRDAARVKHAGQAQLVIKVADSFDGVKLLEHALMQAVLQLLNLTPTRCAVQSELSEGQGLLWDLSGQDNGIIHSLALDSLGQLTEVATKRQLWICVWQYLAAQENQHD
ncbi:hypothetical protein [Shewanella sp. NIFS-20-20]|uniref:hypothetical protein n=1 Tax=Shewanella sp. NIFS-20-20 TaxID=2853806 RepID=UPI001C446765|nr:hypothetical protein [Shewanella sp. NIFS-20-20]MBV7315866.1 hypothetical protein [Shewanella sp. NIFS-20-20]